MIVTIVKAIKYIFNKILSKKNIYIINSNCAYTPINNLDLNYLDYVRLATLDLIANEITDKNIEGAVAELGVYKGKFARYINATFSTRKFYLFDTFEGFEAKDIVIENEKKFGNATQNFSNTSVSAVLAIMPYKENCIVKKGYFPDTATGLQEKFAFVSLDTDLYEPIYNGLNYFYDKLTPGGYIFVHDYNNINYKGAKEALRKFCTERSIGYTPIPDAYGTAIITK